MTLDQDDPLAVAAVSAIQSGDVPALSQLLRDHDGLASVRIAPDPRHQGGVSRSLLHVATDWPGHFRDASSVMAVLLEYGADVNARCTGAHRETPLHWAASSDDVTAVDTLLDAGADIEAEGAVIAGGTALSDATAFGQWLAARRLVERGARATFFDAATLGLLDQVNAYLAASPGPTPEEVTQGFWGACHGDQRRTAELLLEHGADASWVGWDHLTPREAALRSGAVTLAGWLERCGHR